jgi:hypothetical protein
MRNVISLIKGRKGIGDVQFQGGEEYTGTSEEEDINFFVVK